MAEAFLKWGGPETNDQIFFIYNQGRQWRSEKFYKRGGGGIISTFFQAYFLGRTNLKLIKKPGKF